MKRIEIDLLTHFVTSYPERSTELIASLNLNELSEMMTTLPHSLVVTILNRLPYFLASKVFISLEDEKFISIYKEIDPIRSAHLLSLLDEELRQQKIELLNLEDQRDLKELLVYPQDTAGSLMDSMVQSCKMNDSIKNVIEMYRHSKSVTRDIFVTDLEGHLVGYVPVHELLSADTHDTVDLIMHKSPPSVNALAPKSEVVEIFETFKTTILAVVHIDGKLLGGIRYSSLVQEVQNQAISRIASLGGASPSERVLSPAFFSVGKRLPWLLINLLTAFVASAVVGFFEQTIAQVTALAVLLPVVAGQSGNTGAQAQAVIMRGLALREVRTKQWPKVLFKELRVGFINGLMVAIVTGLSVYFWSHSFALGAVMTLSMTLSMIIASMAGAAIPIVLTVWGRDPAQSSSVILTTVTDVMGFLSFLGLATLFMRLLIQGS